MCFVAFTEFLQALSTGTPASEGSMQVLARVTANETGSGKRMFRSILRSHWEVIDERCSDELKHLGEHSRHSRVTWGRLRSVPRPRLIHLCLDSFSAQARTGPQFSPEPSGRSHLSQFSAIPKCMRLDHSDDMNAVDTSKWFFSRMPRSFFFFLGAGRGGDQKETTHVTVSAVIFSLSVQICVRR